ncbi:MAG: site-specific DNA-methyltransferase [Acetobacter aceti]
MTILVGDCTRSLRGIPSGSVQCCVTSPPYYGLRDYGHPEQIGHEEAPQAYVARLEGVFAEVHRVLRDDGILWLNLGDSYVAPGRGRLGRSGQRADRRHTATCAGVKHAGGLPAKNLMGMPWRVALALQDAGWILRQDIIWHKPNPMPESVQDRFTKAHEYIFMFSKNSKYFFDIEAGKENIAPSSRKRIEQNIGQQRGSFRSPGKTNGAMKAVGCVQGKRNRRSVWTVSTKPFKGAHFATFPPDLVEPCILTTSRPGDVVLDPFGGAGTTALVADRVGRRFILCELNPEYSALAAERIAIDRRARPAGQTSDLFERIYQ